MYKILCIIPARSGSKGLPGKNIKLFKNQPLFTWSIKQAKESKYVKQMKIIVSTDSNEYLNIAKAYGSETPFIRPKTISGDLSTDYEFIKHTVDWLRDNKNYNPDIILQLRPTQPCRKVIDIDKCLDIFIDNYDKYDSLRSVVEFDKSPYKMYHINKHQLIPLYKEINGINEPYNQCRQVLPKTYLHNGYIDIIKTSLLYRETISGDNIYPYVMNKNETIDIDTQDDWEKAEKYLS